MLVRIQQTQTLTWVHGLGWVQNFYTGTSWGWGQTAICGCCIKLYVAIDCRYMDGLGRAMSCTFSVGWVGWTDGMMDWIMKTGQTCPCPSIPTHVARNREIRRVILRQVKGNIIVSRNKNLRKRGELMPTLGTENEILFICDNRCRSCTCPEQYECRLRANANEPFSAGLPFVKFQHLCMPSYGSSNGRNAARASQRRLTA